MRMFITYPDVDNLSACGGLRLACAGACAGGEDVGGWRLACACAGGEDAGGWPARARVVRRPAD